MAGRVTIETTTDGVIIRVPGPRSRWAGPGMILLVPVAAYAAFASGLITIAAVQAAAPLGPVAGGLFAFALLLIPVGVDVALALAAVVLLYRIAGHETIEATPWMLTDVVRIGPFARKRRWPRMRVSEVRLSPMAGGEEEAAHTFGRRGILFCVDGHRIRSLAEGCTPQEAARVLAALEEALNAPTIRRQA